MDTEMMKWRAILPSDPLKMNWQDWRQLKVISAAGWLAGYTHAADNLDHFLDDTVETISFDEEWLRLQEPVREAEAQTTKILKAQLEIYLQDFMNEDQFKFEISADAPIEPERDTDFFFAAGGSTLVSQLNASGNIDING